MKNIKILYNNIKNNLNKDKLYKKIFNNYRKKTNIKELKSKNLRLCKIKMKNIEINY